jgi:hypothetical protein
VFSENFDPNGLTPSQIEEKMKEEMAFMKATLVMMAITVALNDQSNDPKDRFQNAVKKIVEYGDSRVMESMLQR